MADTNKIGLEAIFENEDFQKGISDYNKSISDASSNTVSSGDSMSAVWMGLSAVGEIAFSALVAGIAAFTAELGFAAAAAMDTEEVLARMEFVVGNVGERTGVASEDVLRMADALSKVVPIDDEVITSAITMGLTFDGVTKDNIEPLIAAAADLATWTGKDLPNTMKSLALAISDPDKAMRLFRDANVTLTDAEKKQLDQLKKVGDTAGTTTFILDKLKEKGIIGLGEAMGNTAKGKMTLMQTALGNMQEALGGGLLTSLSSVFDKITEFASDPKTISFLTELGNKIGEMASRVINSLPSIMSAIEGIVEWLSNNKPLIVGILAAIGVAMLAFGYTAAAAGIAAVAGLWPIIAVMAIVGVAVALLYKAWTENWGGVQEKVKKAWSQMKPVFDKLSEWLKINLPKAIKTLSDFWTNTLLPAIKEVFGWLVDNVLPVLVKLVLWLGDNVPKAIKTLSDFWKNTLLPAIKDVYNFIANTLIPGFQNVITVISGAFSTALKTLSAIWTGVLLPAITAVYNFINTYIVPIFNAVANLANAVLGLAIRVLAGLWQNVLQPALSAVWNFLSANIIPIFNTVSGVANGVLGTAISALAAIWNNVLKPALSAVWDIMRPFATFLSGTLHNAFAGIRDIVQWVADRINELSDAINNLQLPDWLTPGSPTPFEMGLRGINNELDRLTKASLPTLKFQLGALRDVTSGSSQPISNSVSNSSNRTNNYLYGTQVNLANSSGLIETLQGLA